MDNDVVFKVSCYDLVAETLTAITVDGVAPAMLGVGRFVVLGRLAKAKIITNNMKATSAFERLLNVVGAVEPDDAELSFAADLEAEAIRQDLELDGGESQLLAMLAHRGCDLLLTGDKRAISAIASIASEVATSRIACFEQLICQLIVTAGTAQVRRGVCAEPFVDRAISICFACWSAAPSPNDEDVVEGLASYVRHLDRAAPGVLLPGVDLARLSL